MTPSLAQPQTNEQTIEIQRTNGKASVGRKHHHASLKHCSLHTYTNIGIGG